MLRGEARVLVAVRGEVGQSRARRGDGQQQRSSARGSGRAGGRGGGEGGRAAGEAEEVAEGRWRSAEAEAGLALFLGRC